MGCNTVCHIKQTRTFVQCFICDTEHAGIERVNEDQFYLPSTHLSTNGMVLIYHPPEDRRLSLLDFDR